jgi:hypothetical protein
MAEIINPGSKKEDFSMEIYRLLLFYRQLNQLLEIYFSGYLMIFNDEINRNYIRLCTRIKEILEKPGFEDLAQYEWQPFDNLRVIAPDTADIEWEYIGKQICGNFMSAIEELFLKGGEKTYTLSSEDQQMLNYIQTYLKEYRSYKKDYEEKWLKKLEEKERSWENKKEEAQIEIPQFDFKFIRDEELKNLLIRDGEEAQRAFQNKLYKSTVLVCGTILESLLIDALSRVEREAKFNYCQKYLKSKDKVNKSPEIENWKMYQLIDIAKEQGILGADAAKLSNIVRNYRNLVHLFAQKRDQLQIDSRVAFIVIHLLAIAYYDNLRWHEKMKDE